MYIRELNFFLNNADYFKYFQFYFLADQCKRVVEIARNNSIVVVCDDVYSLLYYGEGYPPRRLFSYDNPEDKNYKGGNVVSNSSFSKVFAPAMRFGWIESSSRVVNTIKTS